MLTSLFYRVGYRPLMRIAHRCGWHYAPMIGPIAPGGEYLRLCHWCGFRQTVPRADRRVTAHSQT